MTSYQFIGHCVSGQQTTPRGVASIYFDGKHIYSYGLHYPLLVNINGRWLLNDSGYSMTTAKHISWARSYANYIMACSSTDLTTIKRAVKKELLEIKTALQQLSKRAFKQKLNKEARQEELQYTLDFITA